MNPDGLIAKAALNVSTSTALLALRRVISSTRVMGGMGVAAGVTEVSGASLLMLVMIDLIELVDLMVKREVKTLFAGILGGVLV